MTTISHSAISKRSGFGAADIDAVAGKKYIIMVKNWEDRNAENDYTITTFGAHKPVQMREHKQ